MRYIEKLLARARDIRCQTVRYITGNVDYNPVKRCYTASGMLWDGKAGSAGEHFYSEHDTPEEAAAACEAIAAQYPEAESVNFWMDDLSFPDRVTMA